MTIVSLWLISIRDLSTVIVVTMTVTFISFIGARISLRRYLRVVLLLLMGSIWLAVLQGLVRPGPGYDLGPFHLSYEGLELGLTLALRAFGLVACSLAFSRTTRPQDMSLLLIKLGMPYQLAHVAYLALRFLPLLEADIRHIDDAQRLRGVTGRWQRITKTMIALIATEIRRAEETAIALETRAFGLFDTQTQVEEITVKRSGLVLIGVTVALIIAHLLRLIVW
jgi:energy-coupling factor transport system permease protein